ncbi:MAG: transglutaminase domain-containing protein [Blautia wexlerae]
MGLFGDSGVPLASLQKGLRYQMLPEELQNSFEILGNGLLCFQKNIRVPARNKEEMERILDAVVYDNPALCYFNPTEFNIVQRGAFYNFSFDYIYDRKRAEEVMKAVENEADYIISQFITEDMSDFDKCVAVHDYMTESIHYNFSAMSVSFVHDAFTAEGALLKKQAVCNGISKAVSLILNRAGVPCTVVQGSSAIDEREVDHAWNMVLINDEYYHLDVTWDLHEVNRFTSRSHMYMNLDDESMLNNHNWDIEAYPTCSSYKENYYVKQKRFFRTMRSFELYCQKFLRANLTYMDVRFEDIVEIPDDGGRYLAEILRKQAGLLGKAYKGSFMFNACACVFQMELQYQ